MRFFSLATTASVLMLLLLISLNGNARGSLELDSVTVPKITTLDSLRHEAILARCHGDWDRMDTLHLDILQSHPGDGWTIAEIAFSLADRNLVQPATEAMIAGRWDLIASADLLSLPAREFLLGACHYIMHRYQQAQDHLAAALAGDESLVMAHYYLAYTSRNMLRPRSEIERHLQALLADPAHGFWALSFLGDNSNRDIFGDLYAAATSALARFKSLPSCEARIDQLAVRQRLRQGNLNLASCEVIWGEYRNKHGDLVSELAEEFGFYLYRYLTYDEMLTFFKRHEAEISPLNVWFEYHITSLKDLGYHARADSLLAAANNLSSEGLRLKLDSAQNLRSGSEAYEISRQLLDRTLSIRSVHSVEDLWQDLGREDEIADLRQVTSRENPLIAMQRRLSRAVEDDVIQAQVLLDSLHAADVHHPRLDFYHSQVAEATGDTTFLVPSEDATAIDVVYECMARVRQAFATDQPERGQHLLELVVSLMPNSPDTMGRVSFWGYFNNLEEFTEQALQVLGAHYADTPLYLDIRFAFLTRFKRFDEARQLLVEAARRNDLDPLLAATLARGAAALDEVEVATDLITAALAAAPGSAEVRLTQAALLSGRGENARAISLLQPLVAEYPGVKRYRSELISAGGAVDNLADFDADESRDRFASFAHDLESTTWIQERMVDPDSTRDAEAIYLLEHASYNLRNRDTYDERNRITLQILSEAGAEFHQTMRVAFYPAQGVPQIQVARVVAPDGTVRKVPRSDILIAAPEDEEVDLSDTRHLVIPFPGLGIGDVIDLVYDRSHESFLGRGWSFRHVFGDDLQILEEVAEIRVRGELPVQIFQDHGPDPTSIEEIPGGTFYRWRLHDLAPLEVAAMGPSAFLQIPWVGFTSHSSWAEVGRTYGENFWPQTKTTPAIAQLARNLTAGLESDRQRLEAIFHHVEGDIQSLAIELDRGRLVPTPADEVLARSYGDCKDKVSLMTALLEAVDLRCYPVLVSVRPGYDVFPDFVETGCFSHVIAYLPDLDGGVFSDPTLGTQCALDLPASICDGQGLVIDRQYDAELKYIPELKAETAGVDIQVDIRPLPDEKTDIVMTAVFRGEAASELAGFFTMADTAMTGFFVDMLMGNPIWESCKRLEWSQAEPTCTEMSLQVTYRDTAWAGDDINMVPFQFATLVATHLDLPTAEDREQDVCLDYPFINRATLRFHDAEGWRIDERVAPLQVAGSFYAGSITCQEVTENEHRYLQIEQEFRADKRVIPVQAYSAFWDDWFKFRVGATQVYRYHHIIDSQRIADLEAYAREHPNDVAFALQATNQILGSDLGGSGDPGRERRTVARRILGQALTNENAGAMHYLVMAAIESEDRRYRAADSLATRAIQLEKNNYWALMSALNYKQELSDREGEVAILQQLSQAGGAAFIESALAGALYALERDEEARAVEERLFLLHADADTTELVLARCNGYSRSGRFDLARAALQSVEGMVPDENYKLFLSDIMIEEKDYAAAITVLEDIWKKQPLNAFLCNNLAWCLALTGRDLERAEELVNASIILAEDPTASQNTLGAVYARQGRWAEARDLFGDLFANDDRPESHIVNGYFLGLCDYQLGHEEQALQMWHNLLAVENVPLWRKIVQESLDLAAQGGEVSSAVFVTGD